MNDTVDDFDAVRTSAIYAAANTGLITKPKTSLFRYVAMRGNAWDFLEKTLLTNTLPLSKAASLNDPFEANPIIVNDTIPSDISQFAKDMAKVNGMPMDFDKLHVVMPDGSRAPRGELEDRAKQVFHSMLEARNQQCHLASFSRRISSELQWSHYADGYKGLAYHFVTQSRENSGFTQLRPVRYSSQRPIVMLSELMDQLKSLGPSQHFIQAWFSFQQRAYLTKSLEWAYEEEERVIKDGLSDMTFLETELVSVILGPRFPDSDIERLKAIIQKRTRPLKLFRAQPSQTSYAVEVQWMNEL